MKKLLVIVVLMMTASSCLFATGINDDNKKSNAWSFFNNVFGVPDAEDCTAINQGNMTALDQAKLMFVTKNTNDDNSMVTSLKIFQNVEK